MSSPANAGQAVFFSHDKRCGYTVGATGGQSFLSAKKEFLALPVAVSPLLPGVNAITISICCVNPLRPGVKSFFILRFIAAIIS